MEMLKDGKGRGYTAGINIHNRLLVDAVTRQEISFVSQEHGSAFAAYGKRDFVAADTDEAIFSMVYTGDTRLVIDRIIFSTNSAMATIEMYAEHTRTSGGTLRTPVNLNRSDGRTSETTVYIGISGSGGELTLDYEDDNEILDLKLTSNGLPTYTHDFHNSLVLGKNDNVAIVGKVSSIGDKIRASVFYFEEEHSIALSL